MIGAGWIVFLLHLGRAWEWPRQRLLLVLLALVSGILSAFATLWVAEIEDYLISYTSQDKNLLFNLAYAILGIGLREEAIKLLFFIPLVFLAVRIKDDSFTLVLVSFIGLGFALEENINYFHDSDGISALGRFLTANFAHISFTGYAGYFLVQWLQKKNVVWNEFVDAFLLMMAAHGIYDFFLIDPSLSELSWLSTTVYIWTSMKYFSLYSTLHIRGISIGRRRRVSLSRVFVIILSSAVGAAFLALSVKLGPLAASLVTIPNSLGLVFIAFMFFREINETIR